MRSSPRLGRVERPGPRRWTRAVSVVCLAGALLTTPRAASQDPAPEPPPAEQVVVMRIEGPIDVGTQSQLRRAIQSAEKNDAALVLELDTPGGEVEVMFQVARKIGDAAEGGLVTVAWIHDRALSAGALVALACEHVLISSRGSIGAATPVVQGPQGISEIPDESARDKVNAAVRKTFRSFAESGGRPGAIGEAMVDRTIGVKLVRDESGAERFITDTEWDDLRMAGTPPEMLETVSEVGSVLALSAEQAVRYGIADSIVDDLDGVLSKIGRSGFDAQYVERTRSEDLAALLHGLRLLLLVAGLFAAYTEIKSPGFGVPGAIAVVCFATLMFGRYLVGLADIPHIVAVTVGMVLVAVEIFLVPGTIWVGLAGVLLTLGGLLFANLSPGSLQYSLGQQIAVDEAFKMSMGVLVAMLAMWAFSKLFPRLPIANRMVLEPTEGLGGAGAATAMPEARLEEPIAGALGRAQTDLRPVGKVVLDGMPERDFEARASGVAIDRGARVSVVEYRAGRVVVESLPETDTETGTGAPAGEETAT